MMPAVAPQMGVTPAVAVVGVIGHRVSVMRVVMIMPSRLRRNCEGQDRKDAGDKRKPAGFPTPNTHA